MRDLNTLAWPVARLGEALEALARQSGLAPSGRETPVPAAGLAQEDVAALGAWIETAAAWLGLEAEPVEAPYAEAERLVRAAGPALLCLPDQGEPRFLALLGGRRTVAVLGPDLVVHRLRPQAVCVALCRGLEAPLLADVERLLADAGVPVRRRARARQAILGEQLRAARLGSCWLLRLLPGAPFWHQMRHAHLPQRLLVLGAAHAAQYGLWLLSWWVVGQGALAGRLDRGWLRAWALLLLTLVPLRLFVTWSQGWLAIAVGGLLKRRLLAGALRLEPEEIRQQGAGQLLGRVIESEAVEALTLSGGVLGLVAGLELAMAAAVLGAGAGGGRQALLLLGWLTLTGVLGWRYVRQRRLWTVARLDLTHDLVKRMVGHRTRLAQEAPAHWHDGEDQAVARYLELARVMDRTAAWRLALVPRGWLLLGLLGLAPAFLTGPGAPVALAIGLGGILLAYEALKKLATGLWHLAGAALAWQQAAPLFHAAAHPEVATAPGLARASSGSTAGPGEASPVLEAHDLVFRYRDRGEPVLRGCSLRLCRGDRLLLEGPSGGGKSTLAALLMGRRWPPHPEDFAEAEALCGELGLQDLLDRMPAGLLQMVGDTGWRLSHGEQSRLYIARALLQGADVVVLDESFAALDPATLRLALRCVLERNATLLVIAHP